MASSISSFFFILISTLTLFHYPTLCSGQKLFVFGDSLYDAGNKQFITHRHVPANSAPYGESTGNATGRWSDGLIVPDYIAEFMGIPVPPPVLNKFAVDLSHGASFAVADATVLGSPAETMTLGEQVAKFGNIKNTWTDKEREEAIYLFYIASDDYLNYTRNTQFSPSKEQQTHFIDQVIQKMEEALLDIYKNRGRRFAFQNLAPLGCLPVVKQRYASGGKCVALPSAMAEEHNNKLSQLLLKLALNMNGFRYSTFNYFSSTKKRVNNSKTYKFETGNIACCGSGSHNGIDCGGLGSKLCEKPEEYLFFDGKHFTQEANQHMAHLLWSTDPEVISPMNLRELLVLPLDSPL